jgi:hypothetical protein
VFSLSLYRHPFLYTLCSSRFTLIINNKFGFLFGSSFYCTPSRFVPCVVTFSQKRQVLWCPKDDLQESSSWSSSPLLFLRDIHSNLLTDYNWKEGCGPSQSQDHSWVSGGLRSQDGVSQQEEDDPLTIPQVNRLHEFIVWGEDSSNVDVTSIPSQNGLEPCGTVSLPYVAARCRYR